MRVCIYQPLYWPPLHYFNRMLSADIFVLLDDAQFTRSARYRNTMQIKGRGGVMTLTVPLIHTGRRVQIRELRLDNSQMWRKKHYESLRHAYGKTSAWNKEEGEFLAEFYCGYPQRWFRELYEPALEWAVDMVGGGGLVKMVRSSELQVERGAGAWEWMLSICRHFGATEYLCGGPALEYLDEKAFQDAGVEIVAQDWSCREYKQQGTGFIGNLSILDLIFNIQGKDRRRAFLAN